MTLVLAELIGLGIRIIVGTGHSGHSRSCGARSHRLDARGRVRGHLGAVVVSRGAGCNSHRPTSPRAELRDGPDRAGSGVLVPPLSARQSTISAACSIVAVGVASVLGLRRPVTTKPRAAMKATTLIHSFTRSPAIV